MFYFVVNNFRPAKLYSDQQKIPVQNRTTAHIVLRTVVLVDPSRLELETTEPKSAVLPLHHSSNIRSKATAKIYKKIPKSNPDLKKCPI